MHRKEASAKYGSEIFVNCPSTGAYYGGLGIEWSIPVYFLQCMLIKRATLGTLLSVLLLVHENTNSRVNKPHLSSPALVATVHVAASTNLGGYPPCVAKINFARFADVRRALKPPTTVPGRKSAGGVRIWAAFVALLTAGLVICHVNLNYKAHRVVSRGPSL